MTPFWDARPTCSGFVMLPKLTRMPEAELAAIASMCPVWPASRPSSFAAATAAPKVPMVPDVWKPFL